MTGKLSSYSGCYPCVITIDFNFLLNQTFQFVTAATFINFKQADMFNFMLFVPYIFLNI
jgi:hypothetical protein